MNVRVFLSRQDRLSFWVSERSEKFSIIRVLFDSSVRKDCKPTACDLQVNVKEEEKPKHMYWNVNESIDCLHAAFQEKKKQLKFM